MLHATADTNIYISALNFRSGNPRKFLELARTGKIRLAVSDAILDEMAEVLHRKFDWPAEDIAEARRQVERISQKVIPGALLDVVKADPSDNRILECAAAARSDYIVSGDKHLLDLGSYAGMAIVKVADVLELAERELRRER